MISELVSEWEYDAFVDFFFFFITLKLRVEWYRSL